MSVCITSPHPKVKHKFVFFRHFLWFFTKFDHKEWVLSRVVRKTSRRRQPVGLPEMGCEDAAAGL